VRLIRAVVEEGHALDDAMARHFASEQARAMDARDRGLAHLIAASVLRRRGELGYAISRFIERPLPEARGGLSHILHAAAAQLLLLGIAPHAVINIAVTQVRRDRAARRFDKLANAVLRRVAEKGAAALDGAGGPACNFPRWMAGRWRKAYGGALADAIMSASLAEAPLDLTVRADPAAWAERLNGNVLPTGTVRLIERGAVDALPGYAEGAWWVQDAAAALPARLLGDVDGLNVADLCAAPGGKTAQLATHGAKVTAVDASAERLERVRQNLRRLGLTVETVVADVASWQPGKTFDAILLDVPCTATGTIRRHPDIIHLKREADIARLAEIQAGLLDAALKLLKPGGTLVYCSCSLEPEEGEALFTAALARHDGLARRPIAPGEAGIDAHWITPTGDLRTLPCYSPADPPGGGMDGFFAARLIKSR
jgi:16S rRNA (cytosine967-C5)-methyltransferase